MKRWCAPESCSGRRSEQCTAARYLVTDAGEPVKVVPSLFACPAMTDTLMSLLEREPDEVR